MLRVWLQCLLVERPLYHRRGPSVDKCIMQVATMRIVSLIDTTMDTWVIWTHTQNRYPSASWNRLALAVVSLWHWAHSQTWGGVCVSLHTSACVLAWFLEHHLCVSCYIVLRSTFYTSGLLCSTTTHSQWQRVRQIMYPLAPYKRWQWMFSHTDCSSSAICCSCVCKKIKAKQSYIILCW